MDAFDMTEQQQRELAQALVPAGDRVTGAYAVSGLWFTASILDASGEHYTVRVSYATRQLCGERYPML